MRAKKKKKIIVDGEWIFTRVLTWDILYRFTNTSLLDEFQLIRLVGLSTRTSLYNMFTAEVYVDYERIGDDDLSSITKDEES